MISRRSIVITGFMGAGKSTVGALVAESLGREFVDMDEVIEARCGMSIPQIFDQRGEAAFRAIEAGLAQELSLRSNLVIATGGGALISEDNRNAMGENASLVCLHASVDEIRERLAENDDRPLARDWQALLRQRQSAYAKIPLHVDTSGKTPEAVAADIIALCVNSLHVRNPEGNYQIRIQRDLLCDMKQHAADLGLDRHVAIVTNETVAPLYGEDLARTLPNADLISVPDGEAHKTLDTVRHIYGRLLECGADRQTTLLALGGGVIGDTAGYVAATYMRGIDLVQAPTSLLSMVDSSVGGKVGVDLPQGKNLIGAFKQPRTVLIDPSSLETLPRLQWRCGMAEVIKHGLIAKPALLNPEMWRDENLAELLREAIDVKVKVVEADPYEAGMRAHLNLGHTFGHAIERVTKYRVNHGEAVAIGICKAAKLSRALGMIDEALEKRIVGVFKQLELPTDIDLNPEAWYAAMATDKKWRSGVSRFVLLKRLGEATIVEGLPKSDVLAVL